MARKPTLSPSKLTTYLACAVRYRWTYVDSRGRWFLRAKKSFSFGTTLHQVLRRFHDSGDSGVTTAEEAFAAMEEHWVDAGYSTAQEMQEAMAEGKAILEAHISHHVETPTEAVPVMIEKRLRMDMGEFELLGIVDRVDQHPDGRLEIVDYKSGRQTVEQQDVAGSIAMACYQSLVAHAHPGVPVQATIVALRSGARASYAMGADEMAEFERDLKVLGAEILNRDFESIVPQWKALCPTCDFLMLCRKHPDFDEPEPEPEPTTTRAD